MSEKTRDINRYLEKDRFFSRISLGIYENIKNNLKLRSYDKNQIVYFPRDDTKSVYIVHSGRIRITKVFEKGKSVTFRHAVAGDVFGDEGILGKKIRETYAEALVNSNVWILHIKEFSELIRQDPYFAGVYEKILLERCREYEEILADSLFYPIIIRVARKILREAKRNDSNSKKLTITHQELANMLCSRRETISTCLQTLEREGFIEKQKGSIIIKKEIELEHWINRFM